MPTYYLRYIMLESTDDLTRIEAAMQLRLRMRLLAMLVRLGESIPSARVSVSGMPKDPLTNVSLTRRAEVVVELLPEADGKDVWRDVEIDFFAADDKYPYFPFCATIFIGNVQSASIEFAEPGEKRTAYVRLPTGRASQLTIQTEAESDRVENGASVAALIGPVRVGRVVEPPKNPQNDVFAARDHLSQQLFPLVTRVVRPVFVIGAYRSGTSILSWSLGQHPNIWPLDETRWLQLLGAGAGAGFDLANSAARNFFETYGISRAEYMAHLGQSIDDFMQTASLRRWQLVNLGRLSNADAMDSGGTGTLSETAVGRERYYDTFQLARSANNPKRRWVDGTPENAAMIDLILELFPAARFVFLVRDPLDVIASMMRFERAGGKPVDPNAAGRMWTTLTQWGLRAYRAFGPSAVRIVSYSAMVDDPLRLLLGLFDFLEEPRFARSTDTFGLRINSSGLSPAERTALLAEAREKLEDEEALRALYAETLACMNRPWQRDQSAFDEIAAQQQDLLRRLVQQVS